MVQSYDLNPTTEVKTTTTPFRKNRSRRNLKKQNRDELPITRSMNAVRKDADNRAFIMLHASFIALPILVGLDKFSNFLVDWTQYLHPAIPDALGLSPLQFMYGVGLVEILIGIGIAASPRVFGYVLQTWLVAIIVNLLFLGQHYDVALFDLALASGTFALAQLARTQEIAAYNTMESTYYSKVAH